jgi:hypothetical protein
VTMAMTHYRDERMQKQPVLGGHPVATTHAATKERQPVNTFFIRADNYLGGGKFLLPLQR